MFWDSVFSAFRIMTYWETYLVIFEYIILLLIPILLAFLIMNRRQGPRMKYIRMLFIPILEAIAVAVFVLTLYPIIFDIGEEPSWGFPLRILQLTPGGFLGFLGILILIALILSLIPKLELNSRSFKTLVLGGISLIFVRIFLSFINPIIDVGFIDLFPGIWFLLGVIAMSGLLSKVCHYVHISCSAVLGNKYNLKEGVVELLVLPVTATLGLIPVLVYGTWLA